ncbi:GTP cyclohydrolase II RibA [Bradyrhizobium sp. CB3481]|uniref:GTP cyclohydrolase II RibA n=1 Tax=Bradyrhizobium sp. CB3481 TaxID=3039158 RepID=UPI0024B059CB|nr:GTP cyclohydrolase II RibA [Bradyrhizobium sp. CB3481]WFU18618.1 GTP cyclohydrolase II RibA [Bradyrhizobium sp. CB3481]
MFYERAFKRGHPRMSAAHSSAYSALLGNAEHISVSRALSELQARRPIHISASGESLLALPVDGLDKQRLGDFAVLCSPHAPKLVVTEQRARSIGIKASTAVALPLSPAAGVSTIFDLDANAGNGRHFAGTAEAASPGAAAAIRLAKLSRRLPAVLSAEVPNLDNELMRLLVTVEADAVDRFTADATNAFALASDATIPLASGTVARFVVFRDALSVDQVAIIVGRPDFNQPVPVRLHSACLTGDVFGSRRCDCGDQLRLALARLESLGGGVILYMAQEGRGIGLANKMRAYRLQDGGLDTRDANTTLGFEDDERDYGVLADAANSELHADRPAHQQSSQARRAHQSRNRDRCPRRA